MKYNGPDSRTKLIVTDCFMPGDSGVNDPAWTSDEFTGTFFVGIYPTALMMSLTTLLYTNRYDDTGVTVIQSKMTLMMNEMHYTNLKEIPAL